MAADTTFVRKNYIFGVQDAAKAALQLKAKLDALTNLFIGNALSGTFVDSDFTDNPIKHLTPADIGTITTNLSAIANLINTHANSLGKAVGDRPQ